MSPRRILIILSVLLFSTYAGASDLHFTVHGVDSSLGGSIGGGVYASEEGYLEPGYQIANAVATIAGETAVGVFEDLPPGRYVIAFLHDLDGDKQMKKSGMGLPQEGYAFSGTTRTVTIPPKYRKAAVELDGTENKSVDAYMKY